MSEHRGPVEICRELWQSHEMTVEFAGEEDSLHLRVGGELFLMKESLGGRFGFREGTTLTERLFRILIFLALRRCGTSAGWTEAAEIALLVAGRGSDDGIRKFLSDCLAPDFGSQSFRLIEWPALAGVRSFGSKSRGPYRLGAAAEHLRVDERVCRQVLVGECAATVPSCADEIASAPDTASRLAAEGEFAKAKWSLESLLRTVYEGRIGIFPSLRGREGRMILARLWEELAEIDMEMGLWRSGLASAERARALYALIRHPRGIAGARQIECHLLGQCDDPALWREHLVRARWAAEDALDHLDSAAPAARRGLSRAEYVGVLGQSQSTLGDRRAEKNLLFAHRASLEGGSARWGSIWAVRLAQNALRARRLLAAEKYISTALDLSSHLTVAGEAVLTRVVCEVHLAAQQWDEAEVWLAKARRIGEERAMSHQLRRVRVIESRLERERR